MNDFLEDVFELGDRIRYVAVGRGQLVEMRERTGVTSGSSSESDRYEELLVNPAMLRLATQRGEIDCGGLGYLIVRYGSFFQIVMPMEAGHISIAMETDGDPVEVATRLADLLRTKGAHDVFAVR